MEPVFVPAPPKSAFNKNRRVSDLLLGQLKHFQHVELKQGIRIDPALGRDIHTEAGAARYITATTRAIRNQRKPSGIAAVPDIAVKPAFTAEEPVGLALAASAEAPSRKDGRKGGKKSKKKAEKKAGKGKNA